LNPVITWTIDDSQGIKSSTLSVDGRAALVYGPYGTSTHASFAGVLAGLNLSAGSHNFVIQARNSVGTASSLPYSGTFQLATPTNSGPTVSAVVTALSGAKPLITWTLDDSDGIGSTTLEVDGRAALVYGPYGTKTHASYAGALASLNLAAGSHTFVIRAKDSAGTPVSTTYSGTFTLNSPASQSAADRALATVLADRAIQGPSAKAAWLYGA
jgi:hypothetical protein